MFTLVGKLKPDVAYKHAREPQPKMWLFCNKPRYKSKGVKKMRPNCSIGTAEVKLVL
jgi:hypothetical protein